MSTETHPRGLTNPKEWWRHVVMDEAWCEYIHMVQNVGKALPTLRSVKFWKILHSGKSWTFRAGPCGTSPQLQKTGSWRVAIPARQMPLCPFGREQSSRLESSGPSAWKQRVTPPSNKYRLYDFCVYVAQLDLKLFSFKPHNGCSDRIIHQLFTILGYWYLPKEAFRCLFIIYSDSVSHSGILISHLLTRRNCAVGFDDANFEVGT